MRSSAPVLLPRSQQLFSRARSTQARVAAPGGQRSWRPFLRHLDSVAVIVADPTSLRSHVTERPSRSQGQGPGALPSTRFHTRDHCHAPSRSVQYPRSCMRALNATSIPSQLTAISDRLQSRRSCLIRAQLGSIAVLTLAPALKFNAHFRRQCELMPIKVLFNFTSCDSPDHHINEPVAY
jgi:hypothetical protein